MMKIEPVVAPPPAPEAQKLEILVSVPDHEFASVIHSEARHGLDSLGQITIAAPVDLQTLDAFSRAAAKADVFITAWGFPRLDAERLALAPRLKCVIHAASSIHTLVSDAFWESGIPVSQSGAAMAPAVAELSLTFTLSLLRRTGWMDQQLRTGKSWGTARNIRRAREISGARIGVVSASRTGRQYIKACQTLGADVRVYDPYLPDGDPLAPRSVTLKELFATSDVIAVHAPDTPETRELIGAAELSLLQDGAAFVNTARPAIVDMDALYAEVATGRIDAALDVFDVEPLPTEDRWRSLPNVLLTPHIAGATVDSRRRAGHVVVSELRRFVAGDRMEHALSRADLKRMG